MWIIVAVLVAFWVAGGFGALPGDRSTEAEGKGERVKGKIQEEYGKVKSDLTDDEPTRRP